MIESNIYKGFQIHIPKVIREKHKLTLEDKLIWESRDDGILIKVKRQRNLSDLANLVTAFPPSAAPSDIKNLMLLKLKNFLGGVNCKI